MRFDSNVCVECTHITDHLYKIYSHKSICLCKCPNCGNYYDYYIEHNFVIIFIDIILHKKSVFRHLIFNETTFALQKACFLASDLVINYTKMHIIVLTLLPFINSYTKTPDIDLFFYSSKLIDYFFQIIFSKAKEYIIWLAFANLAFTQTNVFDYKMFLNKTVAMLYAKEISTFPLFISILFSIWDSSHAHLNYSLLIKAAIFSYECEAFSVILNNSYKKACLYVISIKLLSKVLNKITCV